MQRRLGPPPPATSEAVARSMRSNKRKDTGPEIALRKALTRAGIRGYRLHPRGVPGSPDLSFGRQRLAVFVHGCYWHRCPKCALPLPKAHADFWRRKFELNVSRDRRKAEELEMSGWKVLVLWECDVRADVEDCVRRVRRLL